MCTIVYMIHLPVPAWPRCRIKKDDAVKGVFLPAGRRLGSLMTHRSDIPWIDSSAPSQEVRAFLRSHSEYSHFPVCAGTIDTVLGILSARRFLDSLDSDPWPGLKALIKKPLFLPETVTVVKALNFMRKENCELVLIIDEYGGIEGMITRTGLVCELMEELSEDTDDPAIFRREDGSWLIDGTVSMDEIREQQILRQEKTGDHEYHTLAGFLLSVTGSIPRTGDCIRIDSQVCEIVDMDGHRIDKVLIRDADPDDAE